MPRQPFEVDEITFDILHRLAADADQVMMRFETAFHQQGGSMRAHFPQKSLLHEQPQVVVDGGDRYRRNPPPHIGVDLLGRIVSGRGDNGLINDLALVRGCKATLPSQVPKLFVR